MPARTRSTDAASALWKYGSAATTSFLVMPLASVARPLVARLRKGRTSSGEEGSPLGSWLGSVLSPASTSGATWSSWLKCASAASAKAAACALGSVSSAPSGRAPQPHTILQETVRAKP